MASIESSPTPNPNSLKFTSGAGPFIDTPMESFSSAEEASGHPLGEPLFAIQGVSNVFIMPAFLTVTKRPEASWAEVQARIEAVLQAHFE